MEIEKIYNSIDIPTILQVNIHKSISILIFTYTNTSSGQTWTQIESNKPFAHRFL